MTDGPARITIEIRGVENARRALRDVGRWAAVEAINRTTLAVEREARILAKPHSVDTGELARSIVSDLAAVGGELRGRVYSEHRAAPVMEVGRRPGSRFPPDEPIRDWVRRHGGDSGDDGLVFTVRRAIAVRGTRPLRMFAGAVDIVLGRVGEILRGVEREAEDRFR